MKVRDVQDAQRGRAWLENLGFYLSQGELVALDQRSPEQGAGSGDTYSKECITNELVPRESTTAEQ